MAAAVRLMELGSKSYQQGPTHYTDALGYYSLVILHSNGLDKKRLSTLYSNRAQVHFQLGNYRRSLWDAEMAIQNDSTNVKACYRAARALLKFKLLNESKLMCDKALELSKNNEPLLKLSEEIAQHICRNHEADWSTLPIEILMHIATKLHFAEDYARFSMVCKPWSEAFFKNNKGPCRLLPWVLLPDPEETDMRRFYCPFNRRYHEVYLPELRGTRCWGSSNRWLVTLDANFRIHLLDTSSRARILLPDLKLHIQSEGVTFNAETFRNEIVHKVILSSDPLSADCMVLAASAYGYLNFARPGDTEWRSLAYEGNDHVEDAMYFEGKIYVVLSGGKLVIGNPSGEYDTLDLPDYVVLGYEEERQIVHHILAIDGQVFLLARHMHTLFGAPNAKTFRFKIYKLDKDTKKWEQVNTLGDWSVFVGNSSAFAICGSEYPECTTNSIYFTDDKHILHDLPYSYYDHAI